MNYWCNRSLFSSSSTNSLESSFLPPLFPLLFAFAAHSQYILSRAISFWHRWCVRFFAASFLCNWVALMKFLCTLFFLDSPVTFACIFPLIWIDWFKEKSCIFSFDIPFLRINVWNHPNSFRPSQKKSSLFLTFIEISGREKISSRAFVKRFNAGENVEFFLEKMYWFVTCLPASVWS